nr:RNA-dependent RNA polymerase [Fusarium asiaticum vivivirus 1]
MADVSSVRSYGSKVSVGKGLSRSRVLSPGGPGYDQVTQQLVEEIKKSVSRETDRKRVSEKVLFPFAIEPSVMQGLIEWYPEYRLVPLNSLTCVHSVWQAHRFMAVNLCIDQMMHYSPEVIAVADALYQCATRGLRSVHLETDSSEAFGVHSRHAMAGEYVRTARSKPRIKKTYDYELSSSTFADYLNQNCLRVCSAASSCAVRAGTMVFDLSMHAMSVAQVCTAMVQSSATVSVAFMPYTPDVFRVKDGSFGLDTGVDYHLCDDGTLEMRYPEGVAGVTVYDRGVWLEWLNETMATVTVGGSDIDFRLELIQCRGPFIYCRVVRIEGRQMSGVTRHALEMPWAVDKYVLTYSKLKSVRANPARESSWEKMTQLLPKDLVDKLYLYAMSLDQKDFTPESVLRRVSKLDSRIIVAGMNVRIREPLSPDLAVDVAGAVYAKAFVARYEMGRLGKDMMDELKRASQFGSLSVADRMGAIFSGVMRGMFLNKSVSFIAKVREVILGYLTEKGASKIPVFVDAPKFTLMVDYNTWFLRVKGNVLRRIVGDHYAVPGLRGADKAVLSSFARKCARREVCDVKPLEVEVRHVAGELADDIVDTSVNVDGNPDVGALVSAFSRENEVTRNSDGRMEISMLSRQPLLPQGHSGREVFDAVEDVVGTLNDVAERIFPGMHAQEYEVDPSSMRYDSQNRDFQVEYMELPLSDQVAAPTQSVFKSKIKNYNVERKGQTLQETLTALESRTMAAPAMRVERDEAAEVLNVWDKLAAFAFRSDWQEVVDGYREDKVAFEEGLIAQWAGQAKPANVKKVMRSALEGISIEDAKPWEYEIMLKADAKPPMSNKPLREVVAPQLIVMQDKYVSAAYSSIFRLMSRRFVSLLKPEIMANLLKDVDGIRDHIAANHPWGEDEDVVFLENDFGKFDKSQDRFSYMVLCHVMRMLGFDDELLDRWLDSNERCKLKSMALGIIMHTRHQNKSGGPATALMNMVMNMSAVSVCYAGTRVIWATFMGDDSLVACRRPAASQRSLQMMSEVFNFEAKFFILKYPYFTSCFVLFDGDNKRVFMVPDPVKRLQKLSVSVNATTPAWDDKFESITKTLVAYRHKNDLNGLAEGVIERYGVSDGADVETLSDCIATLSSSFDEYRALYDAVETVIVL